MSRYVVFECDLCLTRTSHVPNLGGWSTYWNGHTMQHACPSCRGEIPASELFIIPLLECLPQTQRETNPHATTAYRR